MDETHAELNRLYEEKGRAYAAYLRERPETLREDPPPTDVLVADLLREARAARQQIQSLQEENAQRQTLLAQREAQLATAGVQFAMRVSRWRIFRWGPVRWLGQTVVRCLGGKKATS